MSVGAKIRDIRKSRGITQSYVVQKLGKSSGWLSNIEKGRRAISADELKMVADIIGVPIGDFFKTTSLHVTCNGSEESENDDHAVSLNQTGTG